MNQCSKTLILVNILAAMTLFSVIGSATVALLDLQRDFGTRIISLTEGTGHDGEETRPTMSLDTNHGAYDQILSNRSTVQLVNTNDASQIDIGDVLFEGGMVGGSSFGRNGNLYVAYDDGEAVTLQKISTNDLSVTRVPNPSGEALVLETKVIEYGNYLAFVHKDPSKITLLNSSTGEFELIEGLNFGYDLFKREISFLRNAGEKPILILDAKETSQSRSTIRQPVFYNPDLKEITKVGNLLAPGMEMPNRPLHAFASPTKENTFYFVGFYGTSTVNYDLIKAEYDEQSNTFVLTNLSNGTDYTVEAAPRPFSAGTSSDNEELENVLIVCGNFNESGKSTDGLCINEEPIIEGHLLPETDEWVYYSFSAPNIDGSVILAEKVTQNEQSNNIDVVLLRPN